MTSFTLDTNCIYAIARDEADAVPVRALADAHARGEAQVAVVAISASENQPGGRTLTNIAEFRARLAELRLEHLETLMPLAYWDLTMWDWCLWPDDAMAMLDRQIHEVLFPNIAYDLAEFCRRHGVAPDPLPRTWRNAKCDVLALWSHIHHGREVFVTNDSNFHAATKKPALFELGAGQFCRAVDAVRLL